MTKINGLGFINHYRNGDCFINKQYVRQLINKIDAHHVYYVHDNHESVTADLPVIKMNLPELPMKFPQTFTVAYDTRYSHLFINTWVGSAVPKHFNWGEHPNFVKLHAIWKDIFKEVEQVIPDLTLDGDYRDNLPVIDFSKYNLEKANAWIDSHAEKNFVIICNGKQLSDQSSMGDMKNIIFNLSKKYDHINFLICDKLDVNRENVFYTDDIFGDSIGNLPQISYLSHHAKLIVGKNSGPFSFAHTYSNNKNSNQTFICFSKIMEHCLAGDGEYYAEHLFSDTTDDEIATNIISKSIEKIGENRKTEFKKIMHVYPD